MTVQSEAFRTPKQARARARVSRILDATRQELEARSASEITMEVIASRAGVPVGSLYHYFESKTALLTATAVSSAVLLTAVAAMVMDEADAQIARELATFTEVPWREAVDRAADAVLGLFRDRPHYRKVLESVRFTGEFHAVTAASNERVADWMSLHPAFRRAGLGREKALVICRLVITACNALQDRAVAGDRFLGDDWIEETKLLIKGYLSHYLP
ncbi:MAG TPA: TetR/AcrR family transcriptional regulator [Myxococcota bacterium]|nr:TetR/AcrR family transcriptional regulator [Myxococcota bacterium]